MFNAALQAHVWEYNVHKLMHLEKLIDIFLSHDWPLSITDYGNWQQLVCCKKNISKTIVLVLAHLHCKFTALVEHEEGGRVAKFVALDKCLPGRKFLQGPYEVQYNEEWLAITRKLNCRRTKLDMQDSKPCEFSQTAPPHKPFDSYFFWSPRNPQIVSFLELLDLPYVLDNASDSRDTPSSPQKDDYSEDIPNEDEDDLEDDAERNNENQFS
ncbi:hypothetical protein V6Z12_A13G275700 [Gossypium hirsutum]